MAFRTAIVIASFLIGLGGLARESFAQYYPPQAYPPPRGYPLAGYPPLPQVDADDDYDLPAGGRSHTGAAGPSQVDPPAPGLMRDDPRTLAALPPEVRPETGPRKELPPQFRRTLVDYYTKQPAGTIVIDTPNTYLYLMLGNGKALRYGIAAKASLGTAVRGFPGWRNGPTGIHPNK
jgi:lipoprotein-anchoring transpeptidase ErfK/SrfK